jgi:hypothetical protein
MVLIMLEFWEGVVLGLCGMFSPISPPPPPHAAITAIETAENRVRVLFII